jgi:hypothetical protein
MRPRSAFRRAKDADKRRLFGEHLVLAGLPG